MKIWTTTGMQQLRNIAQTTGVGFNRLEAGKGRDGRNRYDIILSGSSNRRPNHGRSGWPSHSDKAATWDEWGKFLALVFELDPDARTTVYESREHFEWSTMNRYDGGVVHGDHCREHKWERLEWSPGGTYAVHCCTRCDAERRFLAYGRKFSSLSIA